MIKLIVSDGVDIKSLIEWIERGLAYQTIKSDCGKVHIEMVD